MKSGLVFVVLLSSAIAFDDSSLVTTNKPPTDDTDRRNISEEMSTDICSIIELPSEVHIGNAFFIRSDALIATASSIYGIDPKKFRLNCFTNALNQNGRSFKVQKISTHPDFKPSLNINDLAIIHLKPYAIKPVNRTRMFTIGKPYSIKEGMTAIYYRWFIDPKDNEIHLMSGTRPIISNAKASLARHQCVEQYKVCIDGLPSDLGAFNDGVPLAVENEGVFSLQGIFNRDIFTPTGNVTCYSLIPVYANWITTLLDSGLPLS